MKKVIFGIVLMLSLTGCAQQPVTDTVLDNKVSLQEVQAELVAKDEPFEDYAVDFDENDTESEAERAWKAASEQLVSSVMEIDNIAGVHVLPETYEEYLKEGNAIIEIDVDEAIDFSTVDREEIEAYIDNYFGYEYELRYYRIPVYEYHYDFDGTGSTDEDIWRNECDALMDTLKELDGIEDVKIQPETYEEYVEEKCVVVQIYINEEFDIEDKSGIEAHIEHMNIFTEFTVEYVE